ncbi:25.3 kDa vesicle transport protein [Porphyridium purpureum]|uniref:25.3 kDa vesicle transport protein n=1 Tax=Porphyridium purpureum TaxID=35688 RepID=A0A5J4YNY6_PORPP|nr:25.3 kDa vesicle transport protein [Porphyridium purpureum]|eukprot:POR7924..scf222_8
MPKITMIGRLADGLPLAASMADEKDAHANEMETYERQAKKLLRSLSRAAPPHESGMNTAYAIDVVVKPGPTASQTFVSVESGTAFCFHYVVDGGVCFLTLTERAYPRKLAYDYIDELRKEFLTVYGAQVAGASKPYEFIRFDGFIQKTKKLYTDSRTQRNLDKLNTELKDVHNIMTKNINEVLGRGERLDAVETKSYRLTSESKKYSESAKHANRMRLLRTYGPAGVILFVFAFLFWFIYGRR